MSDPMWDDPIEPRTEAGRRLIASYPSNATESASPAFIRHMAQSILAIEAEAALGSPVPSQGPTPAMVAHDHAALRCLYPCHVLVGTLEPVRS